VTTQCLVLSLYVGTDERCISVNRGVTMLRNHTGDAGNSGTYALEPGVLFVGVQADDEIGVQSFSLATATATATTANAQMGALSTQTNIDLLHVRPRPGISAPSVLKEMESV